MQKFKKICPKCKGNNTKKDWKRRWKQSYKCKSCNHIRINKARNSKSKLMKKLYYQYVVRKQTYAELSQDYWLSTKTLQTWFDKINIQSSQDLPIWKEIVLLIDTTYFGKFWLMLFKDAYSKKVLYHQIVDYETNKAYKEWIQYLINHWVKIKAIVSDWRRWLLGGFGKIPTQMCHFHQKAIIRRYITKKPKLQANIELKEIVDWLHKTDKESFTIRLDKRYNKHKDWINERWINKDWKKYYKHRRTRSAYLSLRRNLQYLFIYQDYYWILDIPNTTNWLETVFWYIKTRLRCHSWLRLDRQLKFVTFLINQPHTFYN